MRRSFLNHPLPDPDRVLEYLTQRQHLTPHATVQTVLHDAIDAAPLCPSAIAQATTWLQLDTTRSIGRLRRTELTQLARSIHRHWRQNTNTPQDSPAR